MERRHRRPLLHDELAGGAERDELRLRARVLRGVRVRVRWLRALARLSLLERPRDRPLLYRRLDAERELRIQLRARGVEYAVGFVWSAGRAEWHLRVDRGCRHRLRARLLADSAHPRLAP